MPHITWPMEMNKGWLIKNLQHARGMLFLHLRDPCFLPLDFYFCSLPVA